MRPKITSFTVAKKKILIKKFLPAYIRRYSLQNGAWNFFPNIQGSRHSSFRDFKVLKNCSSQ